MPKNIKTNNRKGEGDTKNICIGMKCWIQRKNDVLSFGKIVQKRLCKGKNIEYYAHFEALDKRMDEWVTHDKIKFFPRSHSSSEDDNSPVIKLGDSIRSISPIVEELPVEIQDETSDALEEEHKKITKIKYINTIQLGKYEIDTWYFSPYPGEYGEQEKLYICEYCLKYMRLESTYCYHLGSCSWKGPPGEVIFRKGSLVIHEIDASTHTLYCQNLSLLAKLFIDHKTIFYDVEPFLFYVLCETDKEGTHLCGYFCKEKEPSDGNNVSCLLVLPPFQRQGYGKLLIGLSYALSKMECLPGSPEKPLSDLGRLSYQSYWSWALLDIFKDLDGIITLSSLSEMTGITRDDIIYTLLSLNMLKYWNGDTVVVLHDVVERLICSGQIKRPRFTVDMAHLHWTPYSLRSKESGICEE